MSLNQAFDGNIEKGDAMVNRRKSQNLVLEMRSMIFGGRAASQAFSFPIYDNRRIQRLYDGREIGSVN
jgi:hypothetical protein